MGNPKVPIHYVADVEGETEFQRWLAPRLPPLVEGIDARPSIPGRCQRRCTGAFFAKTGFTKWPLGSADCKDREHRITNIAEDFTAMLQNGSGSAVEEVIQGANEFFHRN
jgi:hypothetical protein